MLTSYFPLLYTIHVLKYKRFLIFVLNLRNRAALSGPLCDDTRQEVEKMMSSCLVELTL